MSRLTGLRALNDTGNFSGTLKVRRNPNSAKPKNVAQDDSIFISTPKLVSAKVLTPGVENHVTNLGESSEMGKAKRVEQAIEFWLNQKSFHISPQKQFVDSVNRDVENFPRELRTICSSGLTFRTSGRQRAPRPALRSIFSDDSLDKKMPNVESSANVEKDEMFAAEDANGAEKSLSTLTYSESAE